jgi:drug/metabolite transporter (DMT)-like permease
MMVVAAALGWSSSGFFAKANIFDGWAGGPLAFWRSLFASLAILPFVRRPQWSWWLVPMGVCFVAMIWTFLTAMVEGSSATAIWLQSTAPMWVLIFGVSFFGETFHRRDVGLILLGMAGVLTIACFELRGERPMVVFYGLASGVCYAIVVICMRQLRGMDAAWLSGLNHLITAITLGVLLYFTQELRWPQGWQWGVLMAFGGLQIGLPYVLFARSLRDISGHEAGGIGLIEPVLVPVWTWLAWNERIPPHVIAGAALIFVGLLWRYAGRQAIAVKN